MTDGLIGFLEKMNNAPTDSIYKGDKITFFRKDGKWLKEIADNIFKNWRPLICCYKGQWYRRKTADDPWEAYDPEDTP